MGGEKEIHPSVDVGQSTATPAAEVIPPLPTSSELTHDHPDLIKENWTDPSDLLCSLLPASLSTTAQRLSAFDQDVTQELQAVVDAEHRDFIALANRLGGEKHRIDRLTHWAGAATSSNASNGLEGIRKQVESERDRSQRAQDDVEGLLRTKTHLGQRVSNLQLLLSFTDALQRLETLMGITAHAGNVSDASGRRASEQGEKGDEDEDDEDDDITLAAQANVDSVSDSGYSSGDSDGSHHASRGVASNKPAPLFNTRTVSGQNRTRAAHLDLPTRIHRAKSSWEGLQFLRNAALSARDSDGGDASEDDCPLRTFLDAHDRRLDAVRQAVNADCRALFKRLLQPGSLLVQQPLGGSDIQTASTPLLQDLVQWSQLDSQAATDRILEERKDWLFTALRTWITLSEDATAACDEIRQAIAQETVQPWAARHLNASKSDGARLPLDPVGASLLQPDNDAYKASPFVSFFNKILIYMSSLRELTSALETFDASSDAASPRLHVFQTILWTSVADALIDRIGQQLFFVGRLDEFRANYHATCAFLQAFQDLAPSPSAGRSWRTSPSYAAFMRKWPLSVYFQMRHRTIATNLELQLQQSNTNLGGIAATTVPLLPATQAALQAFTSPWAPDGHLDALRARQWKLSMVVVARFHAWLCALIPEQQRVSSTQPSRSATPDAEGLRAGGGRGGGGGEDEEGDDLTLRVLPVIVADAMWFAQTVLAEFDNTIAPRIPSETENASTSNAVLEQMKAALAQCMPFETQNLPAITTRITDVLKARSAEPLRLVRSVNTVSHRPTTTTAAASNAQPEASYFIPQFLRPLKTFFAKTPAAQLVPSHIRTAWATQVIDHVARRYAASLTQMIQNYESLKRLKRGGGTGGPSSTGSGGFSSFATSWLGKTGASSASGNASGASASAASAAEDPEAKRMQLQMKADVKRLEEDVAELKSVGVVVDLAALQSWQDLHKVIDGKQAVQ